ncbi:hypothetical protein KXX03_000943 [Aspergillus fumigatus]|nr:hypothetical protein KXX03_000943 [Aspergillus fumigatus]KAH2981651.1 hypothetical protein KXW58_001705 [Aspergillus fumigatus]KMK55338.1 hypothetical protein Y699_07443 [Aspergillus fumigatus Z5]
MVENKFIKVDRESFPYVFVKDADVEEWPTNTVLEPNETLVLEIAGRDTQGIGKILPQAPPDDRDPRVFDGLNPLELGKEDSWLLLPSFRLGKRAPVIV